MYPFPNVNRNTVTASLILSRLCVWQTYMRRPSKSGKGTKQVLHLNLAQQQLDSQRTQREKTCRSYIYFAIDQLGMFCTVCPPPLPLQISMSQCTCRCVCVCVCVCSVNDYVHCSAGAKRTAERPVKDRFVFVPPKFRRGQCGH